MIRHTACLLLAAALAAPAAETLVGGPYVVNVGPRTATVCWVVQASEVRLGAAAEQLNIAAPVLQSRNVTYAGLKPGNTYYYNVNDSEAGKGSFKTPPDGDVPFNFIVYGMPKIGKTTLASKFPKAIFLATEDGQNAIECFRVGIDTWSTFLDVCAELKAGQHNFETIIVDTLDNLWVLCQRHVCEKRGIEHESELAYGLGAELVRSEFFRTLNKLAMLPYGLVMISHAVVREITTRTGKIDRVLPSFKEKEILFTAVNLPNFLVRFFTSSYHKRPPDVSPGGGSGSDVFVVGV